MGLALVVIAVVFITQLERRYVFFPDKEIVSSPDKVDLVYEDIYFVTDDDLKLNGWYIPGAGDITWLWFHGNAGNIGHRVEEMALIHRRLGGNQFIIDYRGYGRSEGKPSVKGTQRDARAALNYLRRRPDVDRQKIVYFGHSVGAAVALELAVSEPPLGLALVSPFSSLADMASLAYPHLPFRWLVRNKYNSMADIQKVNRPVLILHGAQDDIVPLSQAQKLFEAANSPKRLETLPEASHHDTYVNGGSVYWETLYDFLEAIRDNDRE